MPCNKKNLQVSPADFTYFWLLVISVKITSSKGNQIALTIIALFCLSIEGAQVIVFNRPAHTLDACPVYLLGCQVNGHGLLSRWAKNDQVHRTERIGSDSGGEGCSIFYLELTGEAVLVKKTEVEETQFQSTFLSRIPSLQSARSSLPNFTYAMPIS